jgi:hypothetical protein
MTHDPMCPFAPWPDERCYQPDAGVSICSIIAKVREDERDKDLDYRYIAAQAEAQGQRDMLAKCITLIEESVPWSTENWIAVDERAAILTALRALQEKP